jgi:hypothetical protein
MYVDFSEWMVRDGRMPHLRRGDRLCCALGFQPSQISPTADQVPTYSHKQDITCCLTGEIVFLTHQVYVVDFGLLAYSVTPPPQWATPGQWVRVKATVAVDPLIYCIHDTPNIPALRQSFQICRIELEITPWRQIQDSAGRRHLVRDAAERSYKSVEELDTQPCGDLQELRNYRLEIKPLQSDRELF